MNPVILRRRPLLRLESFSRLFPSGRSSDGRIVFRPLSPRGYLLAGFTAAVCGWAVLVCLPADPYTRSQWLRDTDYIKGRWIYERLNFDPTPVDVAFIGTSHMLTGVDDQLVEQTADEGVGAATAVHVVNLALPHYGRDIDFLLTRLLLEHKRPKLLVLETDYIEFRVNHPLFPLIADPHDLITAPLLINTGLLDDVVWLAKRRLQIFAAGLLGSEGAPAPFDPSAYGGAHRNDTYQTMMHGGLLSPPRVTHPDTTALRADAAQEVRAEMAKGQEYDRWGWIELRYHRIFMERLLDAARQAGTRVVFLYLPTFGAPALPRDAVELSRHGDIWTVPPEILQDPTLWADKSHLNVHGARRLSAWLGTRLAAAGETTTGDRGARTAD